jgi:hypothetical protein
MAIKSKILTILKLLPLILALCAGVFIVGLNPGPCSPRIQIVDSLKNPIMIQAIEPHYLVGEDGQKIALPYVLQLPVTNEVFSAALSRGVEIDTHGNVYGLLKIWHYCGTDPVRLHIARINLTALVILLEPDFIHLTVDTAEATRIQNFIRFGSKAGSTYSEHGWSVTGLALLREVEEYCFPTR